MEIETYPDAEGCAVRTAHLLADAINGGARNIAVSGGSTPRRVYELLGPLVRDWRAVTLWYGDERCVPPDDEDSTHKLVLESLDAPEARIERVLGEQTAEQAAADYSARFGPDRVFDVALQGLGEDGHTASLFPGHPMLHAPGIVVPVHDSPKPPPDRVTFTLEVLNASRQIVLLCPGDGKRTALQRVLAGPDADVPASLLARDHLTVITDQADLETFRIPAD